LQTWQKDTIFFDISYMGGARLAGLIWVEVFERHGGERNPGKCGYWMADVTDDYFANVYIFLFIFS
jgi:hypothetical protein